MPDIIDHGRQLYTALQTGDVDALHRLLAPDFRGELTAGLPHGFGRVYDGLDAMIGDGWAKVGEWFDMRPEPERLIDGDMLVARGFYVDTARPTGRPVRAAFAHFWSWNGQRFKGVAQVSDSGALRDALA